MVHALALERGIETVQASTKQIERRKVQLTDTDLPVGGVPFILQAMHQMGIEVPPHNPYPDVLKPWLHRNVRLVRTLGQVQDELRDGAPSIFVKPAQGWKRFTGFVATDPSDPQFNGCSRRVPVWVSDPVQIVSEWRCYVAHNELLACEFADFGGDKSVQPGQSEIAKALAALAGNGAPAGYVIDFGVLADGRTALIELNDGFSFGAYGSVTADIIFRVMAARWAELIAMALIVPL